MRLLITGGALLMTSLQASLITDHGSVFFSPEDALEKRLVELIDQESDSIQMAIYCLTHQEIANALIRAKLRGVDVQVVVDKYSVKMKSPLSKMADAGIAVYVWDGQRLINQKKESAIMHHKFCIFGQETLWTGSFNFTYRASRIHHENALVLKNPEMVSEFRKQFEVLLDEGSLPLRDYIPIKTSPFFQDKTETTLSKIGK